MPEQLDLNELRDTLEAVRKLHAAAKCKAIKQPLAIAYQALADIKVVRDEFARLKTVAANVNGDQWHDERPGLGHEQ